MKKIYITEKQLNELIDSSLIFSTDTTPEYQSSTISTTEPVGDENFGNPMTSDDRANSMAPGLFQRMTSKNVYSGPSI